MEKRVIIFVCRGNILRSPVAEYIFNQELKVRKLSKDFRTISRSVQGTTADPEKVRYSNIYHYKDYWKDVEPALKDMRIDISQHSSRPISSKDIKSASLVLAMDKKVYSALLTLFPNFKDRIYLFSDLGDEVNDISDPQVRMEKEVIFQKLAEIKRAVIGELDKLLDLMGR